MSKLDSALDTTREVVKLDASILDNSEMACHKLELVEWLEQYTTAVDDAPASIKTTRRG